MTPKNPNENDKLNSKEVITKNNLKSGNPKDDNPTQGRDLLEQAFSSNKMVYRNYQKRSQYTKRDFTNN